MRRMHRVHTAELEKIADDIAEELDRAETEDSEHFHAYAFTFGPKNFVRFKDSKPRPQLEAKILELLKSEPAAAYVLRIERSEENEK
jgi:hypothetical protein